MHEPAADAVPAQSLSAKLIRNRTNTVSHELGREGQRTAAGCDGHARVLDAAADVRRAGNAGDCEGCR